MVLGYGSPNAGKASTNSCLGHRPHLRSFKHVLFMVFAPFVYYFIINVIIIDCLSDISFFYARDNIIILAYKLSVSIKML